MVRTLVKLNSYKIAMLTIMFNIADRILYCFMLYFIFSLPGVIEVIGSLYEWSLGKALLFCSLVIYFFAKTIKDCVDFFTEEINSKSVEVKIKLPVLNYDKNLEFVIDSLLRMDSNIPQDVEIKVYHEKKI